MNLCKTGILSLYHVFGSQKRVEHLLQKNWCVSTDILLFTLTDCAKTNKMAIGNDLNYKFSRITLEV